jgi:hypothetical protein
VEDAEGHLVRRVAEVRVEVGELVRGAERLVRDGAKRERDDIEEARARRLLGPAPRPVRAPLELVLVDVGPDENRLLDRRHEGPRVRAEGIRLDGNVAPLRHSDPLLAARRLNDLAGALVAREHHREPSALRNEEARERQDHARPVRGLPVSGEGAAMPDAGERAEHGLEDLATRAAARLGDEPDTAGVALASGVVELWRGCAQVRLSSEGRLLEASRRRRGRIAD